MEGDEILLDKIEGGEGEKQKIKGGTDERNITIMLLKEL